ncbi:MAG: ERCC4 domain-containing protein [Candidatus Methanoperedens sp.]
MKHYKIVVDSKEKDSSVAKVLEKHDLEIEIATLEAGDYIVNHRIALERLTKDDILKSIFEGEKLSSKIGDMTSIYERSILIIEGEDPFFPGRPFNLSFIQSFLKTLAVSFGVSTLFTLNDAQTAEVISSIARAEHLNKPEPSRIQEIQ